MKKTKNLHDRTDITILAQLDSSDDDKVRLFLLDKLAVIKRGWKISDTFAAGSGKSSVSVRVLSTDAEVTVTDGNGTWQTGTASSGGVTLYFADASFDIPSPGSDPVKDSFSILVGGHKADPTVVIKRSGSDNELTVGAADSDV